MQRQEERQLVQQLSAAVASGGARLNLRSNEVMPLMFSSVDSVPAFATMLSMPRFSDTIVRPGDSSSPSFPDEPTPRSVSLSIARVARVRNRNQQCSYQVLPAAGNAAGGNKPALNTSSQLSEPLRAGAPHPQPQSPPRMPERDH